MKGKLRYLTSIMFCLSLLSDSAKLHAAQEDDQCRTITVTERNSIDEIRQAYKDFLLRCHPDKKVPDDNNNKKQITEEFIASRDAYNALLDLKLGRKPAVKKRVRRPVSFAGGAEGGFGYGLSKVVWETINTLSTATNQAYRAALDTYTHAMQEAETLSPEGQRGFLLGQIAATFAITTLSYDFIQGALGRGRLAAGVGASLPAIHGGAGILGTLRSIFPPQEARPASLETEMN